MGNIKPWSPCMSCPHAKCEAVKQLALMNLTVRECEQDGEGKVRIWTKPNKSGLVTLTYSGVVLNK